MAYVSLFGVGAAIVGAIPFICLLAAASLYSRCAGAADKVLACAFDPQPLGFAIGAIAGGFATALGGLGVYMAATRRPAPPPQVPQVPQGVANG